MGVARAALLLLAACPSKGRAVEDARSGKLGRGIDDNASSAARPGLGAAGRAGTTELPRAESPRARGDVQVRVEWKNTPTAARASGGRTPCGTASAPAVSPTTTWGIPDVVVMIDAIAPPSSSVDTASSSGALEQPASTGDFGTIGGRDPDQQQEAETRVVFDGCTLSPRIAVGRDLIVASSSYTPAQVALRRIQAARPLVPAAADSAPRTIYLPVIGHEVAVSLRPDSLYRLKAGSETATIVVPPTPYYGVTEADGQVVVRDVPTGTFGVAALIPERSGQPARVAAGVVTVMRDGLSRVTLAVATSP